MASGTHYVDESVRVDLIDERRNCRVQTKICEQE